jgi:hypothetical protein
MAAVLQADYALKQAPERRSAADTPDRDLDRTISHLLATTQDNTGHLDVHTAAAVLAAKDQVLQSHHIHHAVNHARMVSSHLVKLRDAVIRRLPAVARQLDDLDQATPGHRSAMGPVPRAALDMSIAHDLSSAQIATAHVDRHLSAAQTARTAGDQGSVKFNLQHAAHHVAEVAHGVSELCDDLPRRLPAVGRETGMLQAAVNLPPLPAADRGKAADYDVTESRGGPEPA